MQFKKYYIYNFRNHEKNLELPVYPEKIHCVIPILENHLIPYQIIQTKNEFIDINNCFKPEVKYAHSLKIKSMIFFFDIS